MANEEFKFPDEVDNGEAGKKATPPEFEVEIVDDTPADDRGRKPLAEEVTDPTDEEIAQYSEKVQERIKKLTHARHDERRAKDALQRERDELDALARRAMKERDELKERFGRGVTVMNTQAKTLADAEVEKAVAALEAAHEAFDTKEIVKAQVALNAAQMKRDRLENISATSSQTQESTVESGTSAPPAAPKLDAKVTKWLAENKWFGERGDKKMTGFAMGLHQELVEENGEDYARTDEYYSRINKAMRATFPSHFEGQGGTTKQTTIVAPATRMLAPKKVQLTSTQVALAAKLGLTPQQYAAELVNLEK